jgi:hypothetical protein
MKYVRNGAEHQPQIDPRHTVEKADIPDGRGNGQIIQNRTQKKKIDLGKMEALK